MMVVVSKIIEGEEKNFSFGLLRVCYHRAIAIIMLHGKRSINRIWKNEL